MFRVWKILASLLLGRKNRKWGRNAVRNRFSDMRRIITSESPVIIDAGANRGAMTEHFLKQYESPEILAFEAIPELAEALKTRFSNKPNVRIINCALGEKEKKARFHITGNLSSSSIYKPTRENIDYHGTALSISRVIDVKVNKLSTFIGKFRSIDILKLDVQGYELAVLKGAGSSLKKVKVITAEVEFVPMYIGQPLFAEIDIFLRKNGFSLLNIYEIWTHEDGQIEAGDVVYVNKRYI